MPLKEVLRMKIDHRTAGGHRPHETAASYRRYKREGRDYCHETAGEYRCYKTAVGDRLHMTEGGSCLHRTDGVHYLLPVMLMVLLVLQLTMPVLADPTDEILDFTITVDVNEDASLDMDYHIEWEVLDDSIGELEWIELGVPNRYHENITPQSSTIDHIEDHGSTLNIYLDRAYGEGQTVSIDFSMTQDHMYQIDKWDEGETVYTFTPAWFDGMEIDSLTIRWNGEEALAWQPDCAQEDGYLTFRSSVSAGSRYTISVTYPNDTFGFVPERQDGSGSNEGDNTGKSGSESDDSTVPDIILILLGLFVVISPFVVAYQFIRWIARGLGFGSGRDKSARGGKKKITRTKIEYYENCPHCGAAREEVIFIMNCIKIKRKKRRKEKKEKEGRKKRLHPLKKRRLQQKKRNDK